MNLSPLAIIGVGIVAALGILAEWSEWVGADIGWRLAAIVLVCGMLYEWLTIRHVEITAKLGGTRNLHLGRQEKLEIEFATGAPRQISMQWVAILPPGLKGSRQTRRVTIRPAAAQCESLAVRPVALGDHRALPIAARLLGPLQLTWWSRTVDTDSGVRVLPSTLGPRAARLGSFESGSARHVALGGARELHHLRAYRAGDPRNTIDWKASARVSQLITRVFSEDQHLEVMILLDAGRTSRSEFDGMSQFAHYVNLASRFAEHCVASEDHIGLVAFADEPIHTIPPGRGIGAITRIRQALLELAPRAVESDVLTAALHMRRLVRHRCLVVLLTDLYEQSATSRLALSARLLASQHLPMIVGLVGEEMIALASIRARDWLDPYRSFAAREYHGQINANVSRLAQLGAHAMAARPSELDRKVLDHYRLLRAQRRI